MTFPAILVAFQVGNRSVRDRIATPYVDASTASDEAMGCCNGSDVETDRRTSTGIPAFLANCLCLLTPVKTMRLCETSKRWCVKVDLSIIYCV